MSITFFVTLNPHLDRWAEGVDIGHIVSNPSALYYLTKTGIENGKLLFTSDSEHVSVPCGTLKQRLQFDLWLPVVMGFC